MFTHFTEEERLEQEDLVLADSSSHSNGVSHSSSSSSSSLSAPPSIASLHDTARASEPSDSVKEKLRADDFNGTDCTQDVLNTAGYTQQHIVIREAVRMELH